MYGSCRPSATCRRIGVPRGKSPVRYERSLPAGEYLRHADRIAGVQLRLHTLHIRSCNPLHERPMGASKLCVQPGDQHPTSATCCVWMYKATPNSRQRSVHCGAYVRCHDGSSDMPQGLHPVDIRRHDHLHERCLGIARQLHCRGLTVSAAVHTASAAGCQPVRSAAAATAHNRSWTVHCVCTDCPQRTVHSDASVRSL